MAVERILVLHTKQDPETEERIARISEHPLLQQYTLDHCYAFEWDEQLQRWGSTGLMRLEERVQTFQPDALIVRAFGYMDGPPERYGLVLSKIKENRPTLQIATDFGRNTVGQTSIGRTTFDQTEEINSVIYAIWEDDFPNWLQHFDGSWAR
jgi:hypothetical protein